jgi:hypothetical protein
MKCPKCKSSDIIRKENSLDSECRRCGNVFRQIFVSYGHDRHAGFVRRLAKAVEERSGYKTGVWIDHVRLREGVNWRREIASGIEESYGVMAFLSRYSARERGVCLDELAIAISSKHGMIKSVLLEEVDRNGNFIPYDPDDPAAPPPAAAEYQWADMSDYPDHEKDEEEYERYVNEKADMIVAMLQSDEVESYSRELSELRKRLALPTVSRAQKFDRLVGREIVGREWLTEKINEWLYDKNGARIMMLYGKPGSGKSMFAAHLQHYNPSIAAALPATGRAASTARPTA